MKDLHNLADSNSKETLLINPFSVKRALQDLMSLVLH